MIICGGKSRPANLWVSTQGSLAGPQGWDDQRSEDRDQLTHVDIVGGGRKCLQVLSAAPGREFLCTLVALHIVGQHGAADEELLARDA